MDYILVFIAFLPLVCYNVSMVNKVNGNDYYDYSKLKMPNAADKTMNGEAFSLNYQRAQEKAEEKDKKDDEKEDKTAQSSGPRMMAQGGVRLELSGNGQKSTHTKDMSTGQAQAAGQNILNTLRSFVSAMIQTMKAFFYKVWNDPPKQEEAEVQEIANSQDAAEQEKLSEEYLALNNLTQPQDFRDTQESVEGQLLRGAEREKEIQKYLHSGNLEQVISLLTDNGRKTMAKNSDLLTYYDRTGRIAQPSASDQERILHGDRNVRRL